MKLRGLSLFSGGGIGETYLNEIGIKVLVANEIIDKRAQFYMDMNPEVLMFNEDIKKCYKKIIEESKKLGVNFLIATPPCQGMSTLGKKDYENDIRNYLIYYVLDIIDNMDFKYILIENVPKFLSISYFYNNKKNTIEQILKEKYSDKYIIKIDLLNTKYYGVPQCRPRAIIRMYKKGLKWNLPEKKSIITLRDAIGFLPSLESGQSSNIKYHYAKKQNDMHIEVMRHTPEGMSAIKNEVYYPKKKDGSRIKGFHNTYKRMKWDEPCPTRALNNGAISGHNNVHPGREISRGIWSDARVLTLLELFIVSSLPTNWNYPEKYTDNFIRQIIGEGVPPLFIKEILLGIEELKN